MRNGTNMHEKLEDAAGEEVFHMIDALKAHVQMDSKINIKPYLTTVAAKSFIKYYCSVDVDSNDSLFQGMIQGYDAIFQVFNNLVKL
jgi:hypothetical protein